MLRLKCAVQTYAWGKPGHNSTVAQLKEGGDDEFKTEEDVMYAELWMGTHPSGPSRIVRDDGKPGVLLKDYLKTHPDALGSQISTVTGDLPFMFKVLSINKALSIQAHPDKKLAERLHADRPDLYADANHKPEMAISLTDFEALCGFRALEEVVQHLKNYPELRALISDEALDQLNPLPTHELARRDATKAVFSSWVNAPEETAMQQVTHLVKRLSDQHTRSPLDDVIVRLSREYPGDRGCMGPLLLNYVRLGPGVAFVMYANEPHAYLHGDILECMACSDNVVRVGLTPKFRDVPTLVNMLTYSSGPISTTRGAEVDEEGWHRLFTPSGITEFEVETVTLPGGPVPSSIKLSGVDSPSIVLVLKGSGTAVAAESNLDLRRGQVFLLPANTPVELTAGESGLALSLAHTNLTGLRAA